MVDPVEEQIDFMVDEIDAFIAGKYPFRFRDVLEHPMDLKDQPTVMVDIEKMKEDIGKYFEGKKSLLGTAIKSFEKEAVGATRIANSIESIVMEKAKAGKKAVIHPLTYARREDQDEIIFLDKMDDAYEGVVEALVKNSLFVVDATIKIDDYKAGRWIFPDSSGKTRAIFISFPINPASAMDIARDQMLITLDAAKNEMAMQLSLEGGERKR